ncbi:hypothetical protein HN018_19570 [Lichenicola cladoniae]|uniref:Uncharacterized protein n=1 Tax=Lichenicola cladoniae TaxID=1484109 RepID=A0A6M8HU92_9PROT|nr:hypothetical protein [Lichenicola cladoniae]NPD66061.1 hypothetical protein [Acetobacteraceae bacterium]QKE91938.1 hypothetical protein HN018_19570 [Lichenicola cladoniae]
MSADSITVLRCAPQLRLAKLLKADGSFVDYDSPRLFSAYEHAISDLTALANGLQTLQGQTQQCVVRGALVDGPAVRGIRRLLHRDPETGDEPTLREVPRRWVALDMDGLDRPAGVEAADLLGCAGVVIPALPSAFYGVSCIVQASAGHGRKPGSRLRLWFWLDRPVGRAELEVWFAGHSVDAVSFRAAQVIYTAAPAFEVGLADHLPVRLARLSGLSEVSVPPSEALQLPPRPRRASFEIPAVKAAEWAENAFRRGVAAVATAPTDKRHVTCVKVAFNLACLCHEGRLYESNVRSALGAALEHAGKEAEEAYKVFDWAMGQASGAAA